MRAIIVVVLIAAVGWAGYWLVGSGSTETAFTRWFEDRRAEGWQADYDDIVTAGFPNRFDTTIRAIDLTDPQTGISWSAPFLQIFALSYRPTHVITVLPNEQTFATPVQSVDIRSSDARASVVLTPNTALTLERTQISVADLQMASTGNWTLGAREIRLATRLAEGREKSHDIGFEGIGVAPGGVLSQLAGVSDLPAEISDLRVDATIDFDSDWDRFAIERARPQPTRIEIRDIQATWGEMDFRMAGTLDVDASGTPSGEVTVRAQNWREMLALVQATGALPEEVIPIVEGGLEILASMSGNPNHIDAELRLRNGFVTVAGLPIAPAPNLKLR